MSEGIDEEINEIAESVEAKLGCFMKDLYNKPWRILYASLPITDDTEKDVEVMNEERLDIMNRLAEAGYIPKSYVKELHDLLFGPGSD